MRGERDIKFTTISTKFPAQLNFYLTGRMAKLVNGSSQTTNALYKFSVKAQCSTRENTGYFTWGLARALTFVLRKAPWIPKGVKTFIVSVVAKLSMTALNNEKILQDKKPCSQNMSPSVLTQPKLTSSHLELTTGDMLRSEQES